MDLLNLEVDRIIIHQVYRRDDEGKLINPLQSRDYTRFDKVAMTAFKSRIREALGSGSKAVRMEVVRQDSAHLMPLIDKMADEDDADFALSSYGVAEKLAEAQKGRAIPGGIVVVFSGRQGYPSRRFVGVIKAEVHSAYEKEVNSKTKEISLKFVEEVLLTPSARLYKTAGFFENASCDPAADDLNDKWTVLVADSQISQTDGKAAAQYFYSSFLGCGYPKTSARTTKQFYDSACSFIKNMSISPVQRNELLNALVTYLKVNKSPAVGVSEFSASYLGDADAQDAFMAHMVKSGVPAVSFTKDISHIESRLSYRKISFGGNVKITAPSEAFKALVEIEPIQGELDKFGVPAEWTKVIIKDKVIQQE